MPDSLFSDLATMQEKFWNASIYWHYWFFTGKDFLHNPPIFSVIAVLVRCGKKILALQGDCPYGAARLRVRQAGPFFDASQTIAYIVFRCYVDVDLLLEPPNSCISPRKHLTEPRPKWRGPAVVEAYNNKKVLGGTLKQGNDVGHALFCCFFRAWPSNVSSHSLYKNVLQFELFQQTNLGGKMGKIQSIFIISIIIFSEIYFFHFCHEKMLWPINSDMSADLILSRELAKENSIITKNWYYSTGLAFFHSNIIYTFFFKFFDDWYKIRLYSIITMHVILIFSIYFLCKCIKCREYLAIISLLFVLPISWDYYYLILFSAMYLPFIIIPLISMGCVFAYIKSKGKYKILIIIISGIISFLACIGGERYLVLTYLPMILSAICCAIYYICQSDTHIFKNRVEYSYLLCSSVCFICGIIGYLINIKFLAAHYSFKTYSKVQFLKFDLQRFIKAIQGLFEVFGYTTGLVNIRTIIVNGVSIFIVVSTMICLIYALNNIKKISNEFKILSSFFVCAIIIYLSISSFASVPMSSRFSIPFIFFSYILFILYIKDVQLNKVLQNLFIFAYSLFILISSTMNYNYWSFIDGQKSVPHYGWRYSYPVNSLRKVNDFLITHGYYFGYATFWRSDVMTELSNGKIEMHTLPYFKSGNPKTVDATYKWLQLKLHDTYEHSGKLFLLFEKGELKDCRWQYALTKDNIIYTDERYIIYGYQSYRDMMNHIPIYKYDFANFDKGQWLRNGKDQNGIRTLHKNGVFYGPYIQLNDGKYNIEIKGKNINSGKYACVSNKIPIHFEKSTIKDNEAVYTILCMNNCQNIDCTFKSNSTDDIQISEIKFKRIFE